MFACETITFAESFSGGKPVKVFAFFGHSVNNKARGNGAAILVESADRTQFRTCIYEYGNGSNSTAEINWIVLQSAPKGAQIGTTSLDSWTTGTECKKVNFPQVRSILPHIQRPRASRQYFSVLVFFFFFWGQFVLQPENGPQAVYFLVIYN